PGGRAGYGTVTPCLVLRDVRAALDWYSDVFGAAIAGVYEEKGEVLHASMRIGGEPIEIAPENRDWGNLAPQLFAGSPVSLSLTVPDADAVFARAVDAGATVLVP